MSDDFDSSDIREMRAQGDLRSFIRSLSKRPGDVQGDAIPAAAAPKSREDGLPVGGWPKQLHKPGCPEYGPDAHDCACNNQ
ncbi:hypothetical protein [Streptomyces sp. CB03911]|uniref:hypothetical protein n=1 Tax=Streptomyces sp. CB03911 TaxID=1804758 RepID=UPI00093C6C61|nr:hypothetical protein [Streptomyces sp. CB03911]OKI16595.1 hypothetical protein A6A07_11345 [Streptomyces sp. CB03911]